MSWTKPMKGVDVENQLDKLTFPKYVQPKYDGIRVLFHNRTALSSSFKPLGNEELQRIARDVPSLEGIECEYFVPSSEGGFREATSICRNADRKLDKGALHVFDKFDQKAIYSDRMNMAVDILDKCGLSLFYTAPTWVVRSQEDVMNKLKQMLDYSYEGVMIKDPNGLYKQGRSTIRSQECLKLKPFVDDDAMVVGWKPEYENTNEAFLDELGRTARSSAKDGKFAKQLVGALECRCIKFESTFWVSGFTMEEKERMWTERFNLVGRTLCFKHQPCGCYDLPRHPIFRRWI